MEFSELDVYNKEKFVLRSVTRGSEFPFIRYNGANYEELKSFLTAYSPNLVIDPEELKIGELYTYSGKYFNLKRVPISELRFVIANHPYLVKEDGRCIPLFMEVQQAEEYLKENRHHKMFTYKNTLATYTYNPDHSSFMMYDASHPTGVPFNRLPASYEWYIGGDDGANRLWKSSSIRYDDANHFVDLRPSFRGLVNRIEDLEHRINKKLTIQGRPVLFNESWETHSRRTVLKTLCQSYITFLNFVSTLYIIVTKETNTESEHNTNPFGEFADEPIVRTITALQDYYESGRDSKENPVSQVFKKYLEHNLGPKEPNDYSRLQEGILTDYYTFLKKIYESVAEELRIEGTICQDDYGNLYCGKALLSQDYYIYRGCKCVITSLIKNPDEKTAGKYPYYSDRLNSVTLNRTGCIGKDEEGTFYIDKFILKGAVAEQLGEEVQIALVHPFAKPRGEYLGEVIDYALSGEVNKTPAGIGKPAIPMLGHGSKKERGGKKLKPMTFPMSSRPGPEPKHWLVEKYAKIPDIDVKVSKKLKKNVWDKLIKEVRSLKYPQQLKESSRNILCASLIFHAAEESGIAFVEIIPNERKGVDYESEHSYDDYFDTEGNNTEDGGNDVTGGVDEKKQREAALTKQGFSIINTAEEAGLSEKEVGRVYAKHFPSSYTKTLKLMGVNISQGGPEKYLRMLNYWLPKYEEHLKQQAAANGKKEEYIQVAGDIALFLDDCKKEIKSIKVLMTKNQKQLTDILDKLVNELPSYFDSIK